MKRRRENNLRISNRLSLLDLGAIWPSVLPLHLQHGYAHYANCNLAHTRTHKYDHLWLMVKQSCLSSVSAQSPEQDTQLCPKSALEGEYVSPISWRRNEQKWHYQRLLWGSIEQCQVLFFLLSLFYFVFVFFRILAQLEDRRFVSVMNLKMITIWLFCVVFM